MAEETDEKVAAIILSQVEPERARLARNNEILLSMMLFDWSYDDKQRTNYMIPIDFVSITSAKSGLIHFSCCVHFNCDRIDDRNYVSYICYDTDDYANCIHIRLENDYAQFISVHSSPYNDNDVSFVCILTRERAYELIEFIDDERATNE